jgi:hypothetical protein
VADAYAKKRGKQMIVIGDALVGWNQTEIGYRNITAQKIKANWDTQIFAFCAQSPRCVGMFPFLWNTVGQDVSRNKPPPPRGACCMGVKEMPEVLKPALSRMGAAIKAGIGLGRIVALCYSSSTLYQIHKHIRCLYY